MLMAESGFFQEGMQARYNPGMQWLASCAMWELPEVEIEREL